MTSDKERGYMMSNGQYEELVRFVTESNAIEGIRRKPTTEEINIHEWFLSLPELTVDDIEKFVDVVQPGAVLRTNGQNVVVGQHTPPSGGMNIYYELEGILHFVNRPDSPKEMVYNCHHWYESLHPFTDGNGRSGRAIWLWMMGGNAPLGFLHTWYYQSLQYNRN